MNAADVKLEGISKRYGEQWVVRDVDLHIGRGEFFTFLGPSGCGKTTLLRMIAGFVTADRGVILLDDEAVQAIPPWQRDVGMVFQNYALWPHLSVFENVAFGLRERKIARQQIPERVKAALAQVDLAGVENRRPSQLSGGQQQRVALARTLVIQPRVLLLDEPLSNLDAKLRIEMRLELQKLQRELGLTTIYVTHDQEEALSMSTRIAVIDRGRIIQQGAPREIYERPAHPFVAGFVGHSNLISATVLQRMDSCVELEVENHCIIRAALSDCAATLRAGERAVFSIRPEAIRLVDGNDTAESGNRLQGKIISSAYQGSFVEYEIVAHRQTFKARVANPKDKRLFSPAESVTLLFSPQDVVLVPAEENQLNPYGK